jgi:alkaline phosphatase
VTGQKTHNGVLSQGPDGERKVRDGTTLKTILEYAEEHGLATGILSNVNIADATPAGNYAHANDRATFAQIIMQAFTPRFGDGVDVLMGAGRKRIYDEMTKVGKDLDEVARQKGRTVHTSVAAVPAETARPVVIADEIDLPAAARLAVRTLSRGKKGFYLMIEWDAHTDNPERGLNNVVAFDKLIREIASMVNLRETLMVFTADHSFDLRTRGGTRADAVLKGFDEWKKKEHKSSDPVELPVLRVGHSHTGEEVMAAAQGPGAEAVRGFFPNTHLFSVMMNAFGWRR